MEEIISKYNESFRLDVSISNRCYDHKPTDSEYKTMSFGVAKNVSVNELLEFITKGHSICHVFRGNRRKKENYLYSYSVYVDVDDSDVCMSDFVNQCRMKPTLAYTTTSNGVGGKGFRFRLIYVFDDKITTGTLYESLYSYIVEQINLKGTKDHCGSVYNQVMNGNSKKEIETYCSYYIYSFNQSFFPKCSLEHTNTPFSHYYSKEHFGKNETPSALDLDVQDMDENSDDYMIHLLR